MKKQNKNILIIIISIVLLLTIIPKNSYPEMVWGVNIHTYTDSNTINAMHTLGTTAGRYDMWWANIETQQGVYNFSKMDYDINIYKANEIEPVPIIGWVFNKFYTPGLTDNMPCNFSNFKNYTKAFGNYVYATVSHFKGRVKYYEIINEPNSAFCNEKAPDRWIGSVEGAVMYGELLKESYIRAKQADPNVKIILTGMGQDISTQNNWYFTLYKYGFNKYWDIVGTHPYGNTAITQGIPNIRKLMISYGDKDKKIWITETGYPSGGCWFDNKNRTFISCPPNSNNEINQSNGLKRDLDFIKNLSYVGGFFVYQLRESCGGDARRFDIAGCPDRKIINSQCPVDIECRFAIINYTLSPKPAFYTYQSAIAEDKERFK